MKTIKVQPFQSLFDISVQETGRIENAFDIAVANNLSITDYVPGQILQIPSDLPTDKKVLAYYKENEVIPATSEEFEITTYGLYVDEGYWDEDYTDE